MKQVVKIILAAAAMAAFAVPAMAADKLIIKDAAGTADVVKITDSGEIQLPVTTGTDRGSKFSNPGTLDSFAMVSVTPQATGANVATAMQMIPKGTGYPGFPIRAQLSVFGTDYLADNVNYESLVLRASGNEYSINATANGTGLARPIQFQMFNAPVFHVETNGRVGIGTTVPKSALHVVGLPTFASNSAAITGGLTAGAFYRTSTGVLMVVY